MKESSSLHLKVQEMCDCFATTDPLKEMSKLQHDQDTDEAALKWIALAILHGINNNADKISISQDPDGSVKVTAKYRKTELPTPGGAVGEKIFKTAREISHIDKSKGTTTLAFGFRNNSMELQLGTSEKKGERKITITFP